MTDALAASPLEHAIGLALIDFLWQGVAIAVPTACLLFLLRRASARSRYLVGCLSLAAMVIVPVSTVIDNIREGYDGRIASGAVNAPASTVRLDAGASSGTMDNGGIVAGAGRSPRLSREWFAARLPFVVLIWSLGVLVLGLHLLYGWTQVCRIRRRATKLPAERVSAGVLAMAERLGITRRLRLVESVLVEVPAVIGFLRPAIVVPASALAGLSPAHLQAILAHELAHIRRGDYLVNVAQCVVEILLFYHPAVWWVSGQVRIEREHCCDDLAAALCPDRLTYARALASLEELRATPPRLAMAANGGPLLRRIRRLVDPGSASGPKWSGGFAMAVMLTVLLFAMTGSDKAVSARVEQPAAPIVAPASVQTIETPASIAPTPTPLRPPRTTTSPRATDPTPSSVATTDVKTPVLAPPVGEQQDLTEAVKFLSSRIDSLNAQLAEMRAVRGFTDAHPDVRRLLGLIREYETKRDELNLARPVSTVSAQVAAQANGGRISGTVRDKDGGVIVGAKVTVTRLVTTPEVRELEGRAQQNAATGIRATMTNGQGQFAVDGLAGGTYDVSVSSDFFKTTRSRVELAANDTMNLSLELQVGPLTETVDVRGGSTAPIPAGQVPANPQTATESFDAAKLYYQQGRFAESEAMTARALVLLHATVTEKPSVVPQAASSTGPVRVGGDVVSPQKIQHVDPIYPAEALAASIAGNVYIQATLAKDGTVRDPQILSGVRALNDAALGAVRLWRYTPVTLNGIPIEVVMTVTVTFRK